MNIKYRTYDDISIENKLIIDYISNMYITTLQEYLNTSDKVISNKLSKYITSNINTWVEYAFINYRRDNNVNIYKKIWDYLTEKINIYIAISGK